MPIAGAREGVILRPKSVFHGPGVVIPGSRALVSGPKSVFPGSGYSYHLLWIKELRDLLFRQYTGLSHDFANLSLLPVRLVGELGGLVVADLRGERGYQG